MNELITLKDLLRSNRLLYSSHLKMMEEYGGSIECRLAQSDCGWGAALLIPAACSPYDTELYPEAAAIVYLAGDGASILSHILSGLPRDKDLVFKTHNVESRRLAERAFPLEWRRALLSYTCAPGKSFPECPEVRRSGHMDERLLPLWMKNGYNRECAERYFANGAEAFSVFSHGEPVSTCLIFRNSLDIWEVGAVRTVERERGRGYARKVVSSALNAVLEAGNLPKYQVEQTNLPSIGLAESLGLRIFLRLDHLYYRSR
jgi:RimJ/RimL family protein N-acetyltransferase